MNIHVYRGNRNRLEIRGHRRNLTNQGTEKNDIVK